MKRGVRDRLRAALGACMLALACGAPPAAGEDALRVVLTPRSVPFSYIGEDGELAGFNVDMAKAICAELGRRCALDTLAFPEIIPAVASGRYDLGVANFLRTPEREREVAFTVPYWRSTSVFVGKAGRRVGAVEELLRDTPVCAIGSSGQLRFLIERAGTHVANVRAMPSNQDVLDALQSGECPVALLPTMQVLPFLQSARGQGLAFLAAPLAESGLGGTVHMVVRPGDPELREAIDRALQRLIASGVHERAARRYFPFSIL